MRFVSPILWTMILVSSFSSHTLGSKELQPQDGRLLIDDFEAQSGTSLLGGKWWTEIDHNKLGTQLKEAEPMYGTPGALGSKAGIRFSGQIGRQEAPFPFANLHISVTAKVPADLRAFGGIAFMAKGDGKDYEVMLVLDSVKDYCYHRAIFKAPKQWTLVSIAFADLYQPTWGKALAFNAKAVNQIVIAPSADSGAEVFGVWVDELSLFVVENNLAIDHRLAAPDKTLSRELYYKGVDAYVQNRVAEAIGYWEELLARDPQFLDAKKNILRAKAKLRAIQIMAGTGPAPGALTQEAQALVAQGKMAISKSQFLEGAVLYKQALAIDPENSDALKGLAIAEKSYQALVAGTAKSASQKDDTDYVTAVDAYFSGRYEEADILLHAARNKMPEDTRIARAANRVRKELGEQQAKEREAKNLKAEGKEAMNAGMYGIAQDLLNAANTRDPGDKEVLAMLLVCNEKQAANTKRSETFYKRGVDAYTQEKITLAMDNFQQALALDEGNSKARQAMSVAYKKMMSLKKLK